MSDLSVLLAQPHIAQLMQIFHDKNQDIRLIGGCVRDALLHRPLKDIDFATTALPADTLSILKSNNIYAVPTGIDHGTITAVIDQQHFEITTLRRDIQTDGRHAKVVFGTSWEDDAQRRDFTINALSVDRNGQLYDYHNGKDDLDKNQLRFIGDATIRIREDYLRILRYFRFLSVLDWPVSKPALDACIHLKDGLKQLSRERIQLELYKLLTGSGCVQIMSLIEENKILSPLIDMDFNEERFSALISNESELKAPDPLRRLLACGVAINDLDKIIVLKNSDKKRLEALQQLQEHPDWPQAKQLYYFGVQTVLDAELLNNKKPNYLLEWRKPTFSLRAGDLMTKYDLSGPALGRILKQAEEWWVDQNFLPVLEEIHAHVRSLMAKV